MRSFERVRWLVVISALAMLGGAFSGVASGSTAGPNQRLIVVARNAADYNALRAKAVSSGARVVRDLRQINAFAVWASPAAKASLAADSRASGVGVDRIISVAPPEGAALARPTSLARQHAVGVSLAGSSTSADGAINPDPAFGATVGAGKVLWDYRRIGLPQAWKITTGSPDVTVGVADTGLDYTHSELASKVTSVIDFTTLEFPPICKTIGGVSDADLAAEFGGPANTDWNGHGSWIGGNIAGALDGTGTNGIAPDIGLVSLKISQWCGNATDSELLAAFLYAADNGIDIVSISFGGYLDRSDPAQNVVFGQYVNTVAYARNHGTVIVAAAGNEHVRVGTAGLVLSHGSLTIPGDPLADLFGLYEVPGGVPGVVDVGATGNVVNAASATCKPGTFKSSNATCKPLSDAHQPFGVGEENQVTYYSNYGPRIDVAAPGGARKFNVPSADRGGTGGFPYTKDGTWETFSITSNWAVYTGQIPCFFLPAPRFYAGECYSTIQGTSMATPHASAVLALIASAHPEFRHHPDELVGAMKAGTTHPHNFTPGLSATDHSRGDRIHFGCFTGYCHLGGPAISDLEAYGAGLVSALAAG
jgi:subtilisin family serine protease